MSNTGYETSRSVEDRPTRRQRQAARMADAASGGITAILFKLVLLGLFDALAVYGVFVLLLHGKWAVLGIVAAVTIIVNWIYFSHRKLPAKYLTPGIIFLALFQVFVLVYTGYIGFTNYGTGHNGNKEQAVSALLRAAQERVPDSGSYPVSVVEQFGTLSLLVTDPEGRALLGNDDTPLHEVDAVFDGEQAVGVDGYTTLKFAEILTRSEDITEMSVSISEDPNDGALRTADGSKAYLYTLKLHYDEAAGTMTDLASGVVYTDNAEGAFESTEGEQLMPGWQVVVGSDNFVRAFTDSSIRGPLFYVTAWTFVFALVSVATTFALGLFLAIVFNDMRMRGRKFYRIAMILPYAFPSFLSALVWAGLMNESFGFFNQVLLGGAAIPWLTDPWLAKVSILIVNLWLGFPYMFLVCMGALQSIPDELQEAARVDGAKPWAIFRHIKLPLLLVSLTPLLISSFAFNFNNFNLIYMLTNGGPRDGSTSISVGHTDILISMVYKVAFTGQTRDYGLASAFTIIIFVLVAAISILSFRKTKALEELN